MAPKSSGKSSVRLSVRETKNRLSEVLRQVAAGGEVIITSHGEARARISAVRKGSRRLAVDWAWLREMKIAGSQTPAEDLIRSDRDAGD